MATGRGESFFMDVTPARLFKPQRIAIHSPAHVLLYLDSGVISTVERGT